jgi:rRNA processing protein Gar1
MFDKSSEDLNLVKKAAYTNARKTYRAKRKTAKKRKKKSLWDVLFGW